MYKGIAASKGIAIGKAHLLNQSKFCIVKYKISADEVDAEIQRLRQAIDASKHEMQAVKQRARKVADKYAVILDTYLLLLDDDILVNETVEKISEDLMNAEWALSQTHEKFTTLFNNINDEYLKGKQDDLDLVVHGIMRNLIGHHQESLADIQEPIILIAHSLSASDTLLVPRSLILGLATEVGGKTSHLAIFSSAMGIPAVVGVKDLTVNINSGDPVIIDGIDGHVLINPSEKILDVYRTKSVNYQKYQTKLLENIHETAETKDGYKVNLRANIESAHEINSLKKFGAEGVGLYRTEFLYLGVERLPTEEELYLNFKKVARGVEPYPVIVRTLDLGTDKPLHNIYVAEENNPALGLRGIRLSLVNQELFLSQLRAILRASLYGDIKILYPMIASVSEIRQANQILEAAKNELREKQIPFNEDIEVGVMIETPAAAVCIDQIIEETDFISIGTNDLIQYLLAVDRINENVAHLYQPFHPAVLRTLKKVILAAQNAGKKVSICGELGGDPIATLLLIGLGKVDELSMEPHSIPKVKKILRKISHIEAQALAQKAMSMDSTQEINHFIIDEMKRKFPDDFEHNLDYLTEQPLK
ncbi:MAG: phosphoenolpyruvate--protein phosphotransferase [Candidatus Nitrohelix vancouverensis]|uniref:Phosphoenolpyruvate-protein phosphotransferase n=1 Tax=Candidatus Nitrohelix vancouverensis TaxID=2705534 RepID=A0A7T0C367_9BACT|nr:MAG: phosphoenolpyruvate--protein phosphotransferase [Candidatus Nitrohelix vancouverensis]